VNALFRVKGVEHAWPSLNWMPSRKLLDEICECPV